MLHKILNLIDQIANSESAITELQLRELTALVQPLLFDPSHEFEEMFNKLDAELKQQNTSIAHVLDQVLRYLASNKETLFQMTNGDLKPIYSCMFCIPVIYEDSFDITPIFINFNDIIPDEFVNQNGVMFNGSLINAEILELNARQIAKLHALLTQFDGTKYDFMYQTIEKCSKELYNADNKYNVMYVLGVIVSESLINPEEKLVSDEIATELNNRLEHYLENNYGKDTKALGVQFFAEGIEIGLQRTLIENISEKAKNLFVNFENSTSIEIKTRYISESQEIQVVAVMNNIPVFSMTYPLLDNTISVADNLELIESLFRKAGFIKFGYL